MAYRELAHRALAYKPEFFKNWKQQANETGIQIISGSSTAEKKYWLPGTSYTEGSLKEKSTAPTCIREDLKWSTGKKAKK